MTATAAPNNSINSNERASPTLTRKRKQKGGSDVDDSQPAPTTSATNHTTDHDTPNDSKDLQLPELFPNPLPTPLLSLLATVLPIITHIVAIVVYLQPLLAEHPTHENVLDEMHINKNPDVIGDTDVWTMFGNDYWGRPMHAANSHRSWRPLSILSFRLLKGEGTGVDEILMHRIVNVIIHAGLSEMVSNLGSLLFLSPTTTTTTPLRDMTVRALTKLLFALHPCHVEAVANAANRPHILAVLCSILAVDDRVHLFAVVGALAAGLCASETAIFQVPAVLVTMTVVRWKRTDKSIESLKSTAISLLPRYFIILILGVGYYVLRFLFDTLSIPDGLIRPAENPFYEITGLKRVLSYSLILSIHIGKSVLIDPIGFSHEYGFNCVKQVEDFNDPRLLAPLGIFLFMGVIIPLYALQRGLESTLNTAVGLSWFITLFPISGVIKVGTFIADRIIVASTVSFALFVPWVIMKINLGGSNINNKLRPVGVKGMGGNGKTKHVLKPMMVFCLLMFMSSKVSMRTRQWMTSVSLLESSLVACPDSAKSNLEISKLYSGMLNPEVKGKPDDLDLAMKYLNKVEDIDPDYCDVHQQIAGIHFQRQQYTEFEDRLTKAVLCPFTMQGAASTFQQYWKIVLQDPRKATTAKIRYQKHMKVINEAMEKAKEEEKESPGAWAGNGIKNADGSRPGPGMQLGNLEEL